MASDDRGESYVYKPTQFMTNSPAIAEQLSRKCSNYDIGNNNHNHHRHVHLLNGRARKAQVYPPELCRAICRGLKYQKEWDSRQEFMLGVIEPHEQLHQEHKQAAEAAKNAHEDDDDEWYDGTFAYDDVTGAPLDVKLVKAAREAEMRYFKTMNVYRKVGIQECWKQTGRGPIGVRWIDVNKQDHINP
eukprot:3536728-Karenia_brevis.AAC.1